MRKRVLAFMMALMMTACGAPKKELEVNSEDDQNFDYFAFLERIDMLETTYHLENDSKLNEDLDVFIEAAANVETCDSLDTDWTKLIDIIIDNSKVAGENYSPAFYDEENLLGKPELKEMTTALETSLRKALEIIFTIPIGDEREDICRLKDLRIGISSNLTRQAVYFQKENCILINYGYIMRYLQMYNEFWQEEEMIWSCDQYFIKIFVTLLNFAREVQCSCRIEKGQTASGIIASDDFMFLLDGPAESLTKNTEQIAALNKDPLAFDFKEETKTESLMLLQAAFKKDRTMESYYDAVFNSDTQAYFSFYDLNTDGKIREFYKTGYALYRYFQFNDTLYPAELALEGETNTDTLTRIYSSIKSVPLELILKSSAKDLIDASIREDLTKEEVMYLYNFLKCQILDESKFPHKKGDSEYERVYDEQLVQTVREVDSIFYDFICTYFDIDANELERLKNQIKDFDCLVTGDDLSPIEGIDIVKLRQLFPVLAFVQKSHEVHEYQVVLFEEEVAPKKAQSPKNMIVKPIKNLKT